MAERLAYLEAVVGADITQFRKGMRDIRNDVGILSETIGGIGKLGRTLTFTVTAPLIALGSMAVQSAAQFEGAMYNINAIAGLTADALDDLGARTLEFGKNTRAGAIAAAEALYTVFSAGITNADAAFMAMEWSVRTAEAGLADLTTTTEALVASMLSYGDVTEAFAERASNALTAMVAVGVGSMSTFTGAIGNVLPTAAALGMSIEELYGDIAYLTQRGLNASRAATSLNMALTALVKPTTAMTQAFYELGVTGAEQLIEKFGGVNSALQALIGTTDGSQASIQALFNRIQGARAINILAQDIDTWNASMEEFNTLVDGATMRAWEEQMKSFGAQWDLLTSAVQGAAIAIGTQLFPYLTPVVQKFTDLFNRASDLNPELITLAVVIAGVVAAAGPLMWLFASMINPIGLLIGGISMLATAFATDFGGIASTVRSTVTSVIGDLDWVAGVFGDFYSALFPRQPIISDFVPEPISVRTEDLITVERPTSLWEIYESGDYSDLFGWSEFMERASAGGWEGGAISPDAGIVIDLSDIETLMPTEEQFQMDELAGMAADAAASILIEPIPKFWERLMGRGKLQSLSYLRTWEMFGLMSHLGRMNISAKDLI